MKQSLNRFCDQLVRPQVRLFRTELPAWGFFVCLGIFAGFAAAAVFARLSELPIVPLLVAAGCGLLIAVGLAFATKIVAGNEVYSFYHYQIAVMLAAGTALWFLGQPVLRNMDALMLSLGITHAFGRLGCLVGGCCYGRPRRWGVRYTGEHAANGFPAALVGVRLFPIQLVESVWILLAIAIGIASLDRSSSPGSALAWYVVWYGLGRFFFEFLRLDTGHCVRRLTEAQITSLVLVNGLVCAELFGWLVIEPSHLIAAVLLIAIGVARLVRTSEHELVDAPHVLEIAEALRRTRNREATVAGSPIRISSENINVERTSLGLLISARRIATSGGSVLLYSVSAERFRLGDHTARVLARLLGRIHGCPSEAKLVKGTHAFHVVIPC